MSTKRTPIFSNVCCAASKRSTVSWKLSAPFSVQSINDTYLGTASPPGSLDRAESSRNGGVRARRPGDRPERTAEQSWCGAKGVPLFVGRHLIGPGHRNRGGSERLAEGGSHVSCPATRGPRSSA